MQFLLGIPILNQLLPLCLRNFQTLSIVSWNTLHISII